MSQTAEILYAVGAAHIPYNVLAVGEQDFGKSCGPAAASHDGDFSGECVFRLIFLLFRSKN